MTQFHIYHNRLEQRPRGCRPIIIKDSRNQLEMWNKKDLRSALSKLPLRVRSDDLMMLNVRLLQRAPRLELHHAGRLPGARVHAGLPPFDVAAGSSQVMTPDCGVKTVMSLPLRAQERSFCLSIGRQNGCSSTCLPLNMKIAPLSADICILSMQPNVRRFVLLQRDYKHTLLLGLYTKTYFL